MAQVQGEIEPFPVSTEPALKERLAGLRLVELSRLDKWMELTYINI
jgi:hypothetical protein